MSAKRIDALEARHRALETLLDDEMKRPSPSLATVRELKRRKLLIKDEIASLARDSGAA